MKPIIKVVGCVFYILTLGLIALVVNALLFLLIDWIAGKLDLPFTIDGFWPAFWGAIVMAVVSWLLSLIVPDGRARRGLTVSGRAGLAGYSPWRTARSEQRDDRNYTRSG